MNFKEKSLLILLGIIVLATLLRIWQIGAVPNSVDWDEAALGYNAYSILETGKDEYGVMTPVVLQSFNDYKPALYSYLAIPFIKIGGLNAVTTRLPSVFFGILAVAITYFLVKELLRDKKVALVAAFLLAISPWHIQFSRVAFESSVGLTCNLFAILFFLYGIHKKLVFLLLSAFFAAISIYAYQSEKVFTPLLMLLLIIVYRKELFACSKKYVALFITTALIVALPMMIYIVTTPESLTRVSGLNVFSDTEYLFRTNSIKMLDDIQHNDRVGSLLDNRRGAYVKVFLNNYFIHFDPIWLFITGDAVRRAQPPNFGHLYLFELSFLLIGVYLFIFGNYSRKTKFFIFVWMLLVPIPASITKDIPSSVRTLNFLPTFQILTAIGFVGSYYFINKFQKTLLQKIVRIFVIGMVLLIAGLNIAYYLNQYFVQYNYYDAYNWQYGYAQMIPEIDRIKKHYRKIVVSTEIPLDQSYIFFLFYTKYPPALYQDKSQEISGEYKMSHQFDKYEFKSVHLTNERLLPKRLYVVGGNTVPKDFKVLKTVYYPNGNPAMSLVENGKINKEQL